METKHETKHGTEQEVVRDEPKLVIIVRKDGLIAAWCSTIRKLTGKCPEKFERECEECWCG